MKMRSLVFAAVAAVAVGTSAKSEVRARVWMLDHADPNADELGELRAENPDAYALVKALLTKRSLGLLDPKHPTASFAKPAPEEEGDHPVGAAVYAKFATTDKERQALAGSEPVYDTPVADEVVAPSPEAGSHDWLNWKPASSAASDDALVNNVLGSVAGLMGKKVAAPPPPHPAVGSLEADEESILSGDDAAAAPQPVAQPVVEQPAPVQNNFLAKVPESQPESQPKQTNSYLDGLDLTADTKPDAPVSQPAVVDTPPAPVAAVDTMNGGKSALDSFSFSDGDAPTTTAAPKVQTPAPKGSALGSWLGMAKPHVQEVAAPVAAAEPAADANPYLTDLQ